MLYMVTFAIHILQMLAYIPYMDPMGIYIYIYIHMYIYIYIYLGSQENKFILLYILGCQKTSFR